MPIVHGVKYVDNSSVNRSCNQPIRRESNLLDGIHKSRAGSCSPRDRFTTALKDEFSKYASRSVAQNCRADVIIYILRERPRESTRDFRANSETGAGCFGVRVHPRRAS